MATTTVFPLAFFISLLNSSKKSVRVFISQLSFMVGCLSQLVIYHCESTTNKMVSSLMFTFLIAQPFSGKKVLVPNASSTNNSCWYNPEKPLYQS